jgi:hypothetical protein
MDLLRTTRNSLHCSYKTPLLDAAISTERLSRRAIPKESRFMDDSTFGRADFGLLVPHSLLVAVIAGPPTLAFLGRDANPHVCRR